MPPSRQLLLHVLLQVVLLAEMRNLLLPHEPPEGVFQFGLLDEKIVFRIDTGSVLGALEVEREPLLDALQLCALRQVQSLS